MLAALMTVALGEMGVKPVLLSRSFSGREA